MHERRFLWVMWALLLALIISCAPKVVMSRSASTAAPAVAPAAEAEKSAAEAPVAGAQAAPPAKSNDGGASDHQADLVAASSSLSLTGRKIIKRGDMRLVVADTDRALDEAVAIAVDSGGYVISAETKLVDGLREADLTFGIPVEQFEAVQAKMRRLALRVTDDQASGEDVTDQYVDLQSKLINLEATAARVREFLKDAKTVEEALKVNQQLSELEAEIEQVKGRMNYLKDRAAFSTLTVGLRPERPTPTPTPTLTPMPTPTPRGWHPEQTVRSASRTLITLLQMVGNLLIWLVLVGVPILVPLVLVVWLIRRFGPKKTQEPTASPHEATKPKDDKPA